MKFITLTLLGDTQKVTINFDHCESIIDFATYTTVYMINNEKYNIKERANQILACIPE
jgi:uncharacterized protein YlzI (FlbEa/FlbD family)